ncbi:Biopterin-dependent aromatic amino acid hydroxylase-domain-containing protein [Catenaria anguillulae PL171]|uniref:phenylalanine 4-monooxygenase n=1 Tax=Catenaria anguillulae PL171 TaxID=765915 RepID=A0A1Y2HWS4_9FUNG|nr:Biopterin-dependent aromatic amino acid hydroxylase-domain-containing protein [Catenaria anguillulae PL171]
MLPRLLLSSSRSTPSASAAVSAASASRVGATASNRNLIPRLPAPLTSSGLSARLTSTARPALFARSFVTSTDPALTQATAVTSPVTRRPDGFPQKTTLLFSIQDSVGALDKVLRIIGTDLGISLTRIESRPSKTKDFDYDFFVDFDAKSKSQIDVVVAHLSGSPDSPAKRVRVASEGELGLQSAGGATMPWFPRKLTDLDSFASKVLSYGAELDSDHPGFTDKAYRERRKRITDNALAYRTGMALPNVDYTQDEVKTWGLVYNKLTDMYKTHACREHQYIFRLLEANCGYSPTNIPQQRDISRFLKECTGFTIRPVMGLLSSRDFLNALAFRVFYGTQYIRHHSKPFYTPEPDICHELLGHVPLFADPDFADFSQEIGLASIGASDEDVKRLATCYWFTVEFGLCKEGDALKAYGAGLLSSTGELEYSLSSKPELRPFDPFKAAVTEYPITEYQPVYYVAESFRDAKEKMREFAATLDRPFSVRYNPYTESIEVLDSKEKLVKYAQSIRGQMHTLMDALEKL